ncbi:hypothetical protein [Falsiphaeobacter marinintestinus]|uniref:hypothetical protein n=1 Tax=Falsiphaeobacter marinintestinus TaxID=1492905 RepID=UPI0011B624C8|nr:hypothetical protein [Phaeobacter marinintestinus]
MGLASQRFFLRIDETGRRLISWRVWVLVWVTPVLFAAAAAFLALIAEYERLVSVSTIGEVVRVYAWEGETPFDRGQTNYAPVFDFVDQDGRETGASTGMSHPDWNFDIGSKHEIRYIPGADQDVLLPGPHNYAVAGVIAVISIVLAVPGVLMTVLLRRWQSKGNPV